MVVLDIDDELEFKINIDDELKFGYFKDVLFIFISNIIVNNW